LLAGIAIQVIDEVMAGLVTSSSKDPKDMATLLRNCVSASIWTAYFLSSVRVRSTFVESAKKVPAPLVAVEVAATEGS
jgi:hypothetical protein